MYIKEQFLRYCQEDEWEQLNEVSKIILDDFQNKGRYINKENVKKIMDMLSKYFERKMDDLGKKISPDIANGLKRKFDERFEFAKKYYNISSEYRR